MTDEADAFQIQLRAAGLEGSGEGVVFPWGVKIVEINGKSMLAPMSPDEYRRAVEKRLGGTLTEEEVLGPRCATTINDCIPVGCSGPGRYCERVYEGGNAFCICHY